MLHRHLEVEAGVERVEKAVGAEDVLAVTAVHLERRRDHDLRREGDRRDGCRGRQRAVVAGVVVRGATRRVGEEAPPLPLVPKRGVERPVAGGQAPDVLAVPFPAHRVGDGIGPVRVGGAPRILEVVEALAPHVGVLEVAKVDPGVRVLVAEERREGQVLVALEIGPGASVGRGPGVPGRGLDRVGGRAQGEQVDDHRLVVARPVVAVIPVLGRPAHGDQGLSHLERVPLGRGVELLGELADLALLRVVAVEVALAEERAGEEERGVDGRQLDRLEARAGLHVEEVVEETLVAGPAPCLRPGRRRGEEAQRGEHPRPRLLARHVAALDADGIGGEPEAHRRDRGERGRGPAVRHQAVLRVGALPEEGEGALRELLEERVERRVGGERRHLRQPARLRGGGRRRLLPGRAGSRQEGRSQERCGEEASERGRAAHTEASEYRARSSRSRSSLSRPPGSGGC